MVLVLMFLAGCVGTVATDGQPIRAEYRGVVSITTIQGCGSGFVVAEDKDHWYVATAAHVVDNGANLPVSAPMVNGVVGEVIAYGNANNEDDVAIIKVRKYNRRYRVYQLAATSQEARVRGVGFIYENGFENPEFTVYHGRVTTLDWKGFIAHNGGVFPGNSGGPLLDEWGRAVGVCSRAPVAWGVPFETAALFVPAATVTEMLTGLGL
jgi:S1-C subfamily serine protease